MDTPQLDTALKLECKVECRKNHYSAVGTFQNQLSPSFDVHELDQIEAEIEKNCFHNCFLFRKLI